MIVANKLTDRAVRNIEIAEHPRLCRADLDASRLQPLGDPVIAPGTFVRHTLFFIEIARTIRAGLDAIATADTVIMVNQNSPILALERSANGTNLNASWVLAVIAHLWNKEGFFNFGTLIAIIEPILCFRP